MYYYEAGKSWSIWDRLLTPNDLTCTYIRALENWATLWCHLKGAMFDLKAQASPTTTSLFRVLLTQEHPTYILASTYTNLRNMFSRTSFQPLRSTALQHRVLAQTPTPCRRPLLPARLRFMSSSSSSSTKQTWVVYAPDKTETGTLERRQSVRSKHLERVADFHDTGYVST